MKKDDQEYQGWTNWATWNISLWINNDEDTYKALQCYKPYTEKSIKAAVLAIYPEGTPDMQPDDQWEMGNVDWSAIMETVNNE